MCMVCLGILATMAMQVYNEQKKRVGVAIMNANLRNMLSAQETYYIDRQIYASCSGENEMACEALMPDLNLSRPTFFPYFMVSTGPYSDGLMTPGDAAYNFVVRMESTEDEGGDELGVNCDYVANTPGMITYTIPGTARTIIASTGAPRCFYTPIDF
ncbi:hypothetical protein JNK13_11020 [bacterium]|nr:hypothetical protein [bacterium]